MRKYFITILSLLYLKYVFTNDKYQEALDHLYFLEEYAYQYISADPRLSVNDLMLSFIKYDRYLEDIFWEEIEAPECPEAFIGFVAQLDEMMKRGSYTYELARYGKDEVIMEDAEETPIDLVKLFGSVSVFDFIGDITNEYSIQCNWGIDLVYFISEEIRYFNGTTFDELYEEARERIEDPTSYMGISSIVADMDAITIYQMRKKNPKTYYRAILKQYASSITMTKRVETFLKVYFPDLCRGGLSKEDYRNSVYNKYTYNLQLALDEAILGIRDLMNEILPEYKDKRLAGIYAFSDFLFEHKPDFPYSGSKFLKVFSLILVINLLII